MPFPAGRSCSVFLSEHAMRRRSNGIPLENVISLDAREAGDVIRFKRLCNRKLGHRFEQDNERHSFIDALMVSGEDIEK